MCPSWAYWADQFEDVLCEGLKPYIRKPSSRLLFIQSAAWFYAGWGTQSLPGSDRLGQCSLTFLELSPNTEYLWGDCLSRLRVFVPLDDVVLESAIAVG